MPRTQVKPLKDLARGIRPTLLFQGRSVSEGTCWTAASPPATFAVVFADTHVLRGKFILKPEIH